MPMLTNARHELFAQARAQGKTIDESYVEAGFKRNPGNAGRLNNNEHVQARIAELLDRVVKGVVLDRQWIIEKLMQNAISALSDKDRGAANRALELLGKEHGMFVDKKEIRSGPLDEATPDELDQLRAELIAERDRRAAHGNGTTPSRKPN